MVTMLDLKARLEETIKALELKCQESSESVVFEYLSKYKDVLSAIEEELPIEKIKERAHMLLHCARGYMETSSNYQQDFLSEMGETEKLIKQL